jgi:GDP-fucose transporter C1
MVIAFKEKASPRALFCCCGVVAGVVIGTIGDVNLTFRSVVYGVVSSLFVALYFVTAKVTLVFLDINEWLLCEYNAFLSTGLMLPYVIVSGEFEMLMSHVSALFWTRQVVAGLIGFALNILTYRCIKLTSPLSHNLTGIVKTFFQTIIALCLFREKESMSLPKGVGLLLIVGCGALYAWENRRESAESELPLESVK